MSLVRSYRCADERVDVDVAELEAAQLAEAITKKQPHSDEIIRIVSTRSKSQLRATFQRCKEEHGGDIDEVPSLDMDAPTRPIGSAKIISGL